MVLFASKGGHEGVHNPQVLAKLKHCHPQEHFTLELASVSNCQRPLDQADLRIQRKVTQDLLVSKYLVNRPSFATSSAPVTRIFVGSTTIIPSIIAPWMRRSLYSPRATSKLASKMLADSYSPRVDCTFSEPAEKIADEGSIPYFT